MWYYEIEGVKYGPVDAETIAELIRVGKISETTRVRRLNSNEWKFLDETDLIWVLQDSLEEADEEEASCEEPPDEPYLCDDEEEGDEADEPCWFYMQDERVYGPVTVDELLAMRDEGLVGFDTLISQDRKSDWKMLSATELAEMQRAINEEEVE